MIDEALTPTLTAFLNSRSVEELTRAYGRPEIATTYAAGQGYWSPGDGAPAIRPDPAEGQALGRCAASRIRYGELGAVFANLHLGRCGWCDYPVAELLRACDYATWQSRYVVSEWASWTFQDGRVYRRTTSDRASDNPRIGQYDNPAYAAFWTAPATVRRGWIETAAGRDVQP
jgi:hypothetical protein